MAEISTKSRIGFARSLSVVQAVLCQSAHETEFPATGLEGNAAAHSQTVRGTSDERLQLYDGPPSGGARRGAKLAETPAILLRGGSGHRRAGQPIDNEALGEGSLDTKTKLRTLSLMRTFLVSSLCLLAALVAVSVTAANPESVAPSGTIAAGGPGIRGIYLIPASGRPPRRVGAPDGPVESVDFSPDGRRVAFAGSNGLWVMRRDGSRAKLIFDTRRKQYVPTQVAWSPDGRRLVFISNEQPRRRSGRLTRWLQACLLEERRRHLRRPHWRRKAKACPSPRLAPRVVARGSSPRVRAPRLLRRCLRGPCLHRAGQRR